jgi:glycosyltransferase involved in cell wall biosynthesis
MTAPQSPTTGEDAPPGPAISIIVPVFNAAPYLSDLLACLRSQTERSIEIIAIDDGSTDSSLEILRDAAAEDSRIRILTQQNAGPSVARNHGLDHARGEWIGFADGDDWLDPETLETWLRQARDGQLDLLVGNGFTFKKSVQPAAVRAPILETHPWGETITGREWIIRSTTGGRWPHYIWLQLVRRDVLLRHQLRFVPGIVHQDILWTLELALRAQRVGFCQTPLYGYRQGTPSIIGDFSEGPAQRRARSYLVVIPRLVEAARDNRADQALYRALLHQANIESGHFMGLIRKRIKMPEARAALARRYLEAGLFSPTWAGARTLSEAWRALRCWLIMRIAANGTLGKSATAPQTRNEPRNPLAP